MATYPKKTLLPTVAGKTKRRVVMVGAEANLVVWLLAGISFFWILQNIGLRHEGLEWLSSII